MGLPLTTPDPDLATKVGRTVPGMAFWAATGPVGASCSGCQFFAEIKWGNGRTTRCEKFRQMMGGKYGSKKLPGGTPACKYFDPKAR